MFLQNFFKDPWNTFDFITVIGSIVDAMVIEFGVCILKLYQSYILSKIINRIKLSNILIFIHFVHLIFDFIEYTPQKYFSKYLKYQIALLFLTSLLKNQFS